MGTNGERRQDWEVNHALIQTTYVVLLDELSRAPTIREVADKCGLSDKSIWRHCKELKLDDFMPSARLHTERVLRGLIERASEGHAAEVKLFFQLVFGWKEQSELDLSQTNINEVRVTIVQGKDGGEKARPQMYTPHNLKPLGIESSRESAIRELPTPHVNVRSR